MCNMARNAVTTVRGSGRRMERAGEGNSNDLFVCVRCGGSRVCAVEVGRTKVGLTCSANWTVAGAVAQVASTAVTHTEVSARQQHCVSGVCETDDTLCSSVVIQWVLTVVMVTVVRVFLLRRNKLIGSIDVRYVTRKT